MEFTLDKLAKDVAEKALNEITYEGKTLREWVEIIVKQQPCEDCISRAEVLRHRHIIHDDDGIGYSVVRVDRIIELPSVTPKTSCESCREQLLKHLEKEDWADTVNCVMNMPFMKSESEDQ